MSRKIEPWPNSTFSLDVEDGPRGQGHELRIYLVRKVPGKVGRLLLLDAILPPGAVSMGLDKFFGQGQFRKAVLERALDIMRQAGVSQAEALGFMHKIMEFYPVGNPKEYLELLRLSLGGPGPKSAKKHFQA